MFRIFSALMLGLICTSLSAQSLYRWVDERGNSQFGQHPPAGRPFTEVTVRPSQPPGGTLREREAMPASAPETPTPPASQASTPPAMSEAEREQRCVQARKDAQTLETNPRLARTLPSGERERIGEDERQELIRQTQGDIERYCD